MMSVFKPYIYQNPEWPHFHWDLEALLPLMSEVRLKQGYFVGKMDTLGFDLKNEALLDTLTVDVLKTSEIEGELMAPDQVRSSIARQLGMDIGGLVRSERDVDGVVELMLDATQNYHLPLSKERLFNWHASLFPTGRNGMHKITVGAWRDDAKGPMQVVSGAIGKEKVHFQAPASEHLEQEVEIFLLWFNQDQGLEPLIKAAVAHLWFVTLHPFDDGNGRLARALTDMLLARSDQASQRFYSFSAQIRHERKTYYRLLEKTQKSNLDITEWVAWFLTCLKSAIALADVSLERVLKKARFWKNHAKTEMNERQRKIVNRLLDGFDGRLTSSRWSRMGKCSKDTAVRDINDLIDKYVLVKGEDGGRSTHYSLSEKAFQD